MSNKDLRKKGRRENPKHLLWYLSLPSDGNLKLDPLSSLLRLEGTLESTTKKFLVISGIPENAFLCFHHISYFKDIYDIFFASLIHFAHWTQKYLKTKNNQKSRKSKKWKKWKSKKWKKIIWKMEKNIYIPLKNSPFKINTSFWEIVEISRARWR